MADGEIEGGRKGGRDVEGEEKRWREVVTDEEIEGVRERGRDEGEKKRWRNVVTAGVRE